MTAFDTHKNFAIGTVLSAPVDASGQDFVLMPGDGEVFAANMPVTLCPPDVLPTGDNAEIGYLTNVDGDALTITRAQEDSLPMQVAAGWKVLGTVTAKTLQDIEDALQNDSGDKTFVFDLAGQTDVTVAHGLSKYPSVSVFDSAGDEIEGDYQHINTTTTRLRFSAGFSGKAIFN